MQDMNNEAAMDNARRLMRVRCMRSSLLEARQPERGWEKALEKARSSTNRARERDSELLRECLADHRYYRDA